MKFDNLKVVPCIFPGVNQTSCSPLPDGDQVPGVQPQEPRLMLRPEFVTIEVLKTVQYRTYLVANGIETEITNGLTYRVQDQDIAIIGAIGGNATGIMPGIDLVSVSWQNMTAYAQMTVVESCDAATVGTVVLIDRSASMAQEFGGLWATKFDFVRLAAKRFIGETNTQKGDQIAIMAFSDSQSLIQPMTDDTVAASVALMSIATDPQKTDISAALQAAASYMGAQTFDRRVIVLLSDGYKTLGNDAVAVANSFRQAGGIVMALGARDGLPAFELLERIANGGFFLSAYDADTGQEAIRNLSGLKGYYCAGNCCDPGNVVVGKPELNFHDFLNWNVLDGYVDLIGASFFDFLPGNGLYVDLAGSAPNWRGRLVTKDSFTTIAGHDYRLSYRLAGNQRMVGGPFEVTVRFGSLSNVQRAMNDWRQDFTTYQDEFVGDGSVLGIEIWMSMADAQIPAFGILLDEVKLEDLTDGVVLFYDNFDADNAQYVPPACGSRHLTLIASMTMGDEFIVLPSDDGKWYRVSLKTVGGITAEFVDPRSVPAPDDTNPRIINSDDGNGYVIALQTSGGIQTIYIDPTPVPMTTDDPIILASDDDHSYELGLTTFEGITATNPYQLYGPVMEHQTVVGYGYCCYGYGCLKEPVGPQSPDPNPPPNIETGADPASWVATECHTETCEVGPTASVEKCVTYRSYISPDDAHTMALRIATARAIAALDCLREFGVGELINIDFDESSNVADGESLKIGKAVFGLEPDDYWNLARMVQNTQVANSAKLMTRVAMIYGTPNDFVKIAQGIPHPDQMYQGAVQHLRPGNDFVDPQYMLVLDGLAAGHYDVYLYGHGGDVAAVASFRAIVGALQGDNTITVAGDYGRQDTVGDESYLSPAWRQDRQYVRFRVEVGAGQTLGIQGLVGNLDPISISLIAGLQIYRTL